MADKTFVQADWLEKNKLSESYIKNKPSIEPQKNADWNEASYWSPAYIRNKPNIKKIAEQAAEAKTIQANWAESDPRKPGYIKNKPILQKTSDSVTINEIVNEVKADWDITDETQTGYIYNKPNFEEKVLEYTPIPDWTAAEGTQGFIKNKPELKLNEDGTYSFLNEVSSDWNAAEGENGYIKNKPDFSTIIKSNQIQADWNMTNKNSKSYILNKPSDIEFQADWNEKNSNSKSYIRNKPNVMKEVEDMFEDFKLGSGMYFEVDNYISKKPVIKLKNCYEARCFNQLSSLTILLTEDIDILCNKFSSLVVYNHSSGTNFTINNNSGYALLFYGDDTTASEFRPVGNKRYRLHFTFDGLVIVCHVIGIQINLSSSLYIPTEEQLRPERPDNFMVNNIREQIKFSPVNEATCYLLKITSDEDTVDIIIPQGSYDNDIIYWLGNSEEYNALNPNERYSLSLYSIVDDNTEDEDIGLISMPTIITNFIKPFRVEIQLDDENCSIAKLLDNTRIFSTGEAKCQFVAADGYGLPTTKELVIENATIEDWDSKTGILHIKNPIGNVLIHMNTFPYVNVTYPNTNNLSLKYNIDKVRKGLNYENVVTIPYFCTLDEIVVKQKDSLASTEVWNEVMDARNGCDIFVENVQDDLQVIVTITENIGEKIIKKPTNVYISNNILKFTSSPYATSYIIKFGNEEDAAEIEYIPTVIGEGQKININLTSLEGYDAISGGQHVIFVKGRCEGFTDSEYVEAGKLTKDSNLTFIKADYITIKKKNVDGTLVDVPTTINSKMLPMTFVGTITGNYQIQDISIEGGSTTTWTYTDEAETTFEITLNAITTDVEFTIVSIDKE